MQLMKVSLFAIIFFLSALTGFAQQDTIPHTRGYIGFAFGAGFPVQSFLKKDFTLTESGFANTGSNLQLNFSYALFKRISVLARANINTNPYDVYEMAKSYNEQDTFDGAHYSVSSNNWYCVGGFLGLSYTIPIHKFSVELRALGGYQYAESPTVKVTLSTGTDSSIVQLSKGTGAGFMWTAGVAVCYQITNRFSAALGGEYYSYRGKYSNSQVLVDGTPLSNRDDFYMGIYLINVTAGIRYHF
jgi:hypothetical protein